MIKEISNKISEYFSKHKEDVLKLRPIMSSFENVAHYYLDGHKTARIHTKNIIPHLFKNTINFRKEDLYSVVQTNKKIEKTLHFSEEELSSNDRDFLIQSGVTILHNEMIKELNKEVLYLMSDMGRITAGGYGQIKQTIGNFTISDLTNSDAIKFRLEYCDSVLKELNNVGLKHILLSKSIYQKLEQHIQEEYIVINHKRIKVEIIPNYLENDSLCLIASSQDAEDLTPGIVIIYNSTNINVVEKNKTLSLNLTQEYALEKVGYKPEFYYLRFLQT